MRKKVLEKVDDAVNRARKVAKKTSRERQEQKRKKLQLVYAEDITKSNFTFPSIIKVIDYDEKHDKEDIYKGALGFFSRVKGQRVLTLYSQTINLTGISIQHIENNGIYYVSPVDRNNYINVDDYFGDVEENCVSELQYVASKLGATYCKISMTSNIKEKSDRKRGIDLKIGHKKIADVKDKTSSNKRLNLEVEAEFKADGHNKPERPVLKWLKNNGDIEKLIEMRMDKRIHLKSKTYEIKFGSVINFSKNDAAVIGKLLKGIHAETDIKFEEVRNKAVNKEFKYEIKFEKQGIF